MGTKTLLLACALVATSAFAPVTFIARPETAVHASRRSVFENAAVVGAGLLLNQHAAVASGGATAGGVYLLSAKQRYNDRVTSSMKGFLGLQKSLESGSVDEVKAYFSSEEAGAWIDGSAAAYLLANAFRRNSSTAPDNLPSVKVSSCWVYSLKGSRSLALIECLVLPFTNRNGKLLLKR